MKSVVEGRRWHTAVCDGGPLHHSLFFASGPLPGKSWGG